MWLKHGGNMQGDHQKQLGFSVLLKDISTCGQEETRTELPTPEKVDDLLCLLRHCYPDINFFFQ